MEKTLNSAQSEKILESWDGVSLPSIDESFKKLRGDIQNLYDESKSIVAGLNSNKKDYLIDVNFGVRLKAYLDEQDWFNLRVGANIDFWRFLSVIVVPHIVAERYDAKATARYWSKPSRIWLRAIWWYAYLSWQKNVESTINLLCSDLFSTDSIVGLVERTGHAGTRIKLYNTIMKAVGSVTKEQISGFLNNNKKTNDTLFRAIMRRNTSQVIVMEPELCDGGVYGYVRDLFDSLGVSIAIEQIDDLETDTPDIRSSLVEEDDEEDETHVNSDIEYETATQQVESLVSEIDTSITYGESWTPREEIQLLYAKRSGLSNKVIADKLGKTETDVDVRYDLLMSSYHRIIDYSHIEGCAIENKQRLCCIYNNVGMEIYSNTRGKLKIFRKDIYNISCTAFLNICRLELTSEGKYVNGKSFQIFPNSDLYNSLRNLRYPKSAYDFIEDIIKDNDRIVIKAFGKWYNEKGILI